jgi:hypothetical protein
MAKRKATTEIAASSKKTKITTAVIVTGTDPKVAAAAAKNTDKPNVTTRASASNESSFKGRRRIRPRRGGDPDDDSSNGSDGDADRHVLDDDDVPDDQDLIGRYPPIRNKIIQYLEPSDCYAWQRVSSTWNGVMGKNCLVRMSMKTHLYETLTPTELAEERAAGRFRMLAQRRLDARMG